ncbi:MAG: bleomycin resistance protein [Gaiellaceae bacterium]
MRIEQAAPVLLASDMEQTAAWYREALGFECELFGEPPNFGIAARDGVRIMFALCVDAERIVPNWAIVDAIWNVYIRVDDVDAAYAEMLERGTDIDYALGDQPWGMREFGVQDPEGHDIGFGQPIAEPAA